MTNQEIAEIARSKGYAARIINGYVKVWLINRGLTIAEVSRELDMPAEVMQYENLTLGSIAIVGLSN